MDKAANLGIAELRLGLALELRLVQADADDRAQALTAVVAGEVVVFLLQDVLLARVLVHGARQRVAEALEVRAAFGRVDVVGERAHVFRVARVPLHRDLDLAYLVGCLEVDGTGVERLFAVVDVLDEVDDAALVLKDLFLGLVAALVAERDLEVLVEKRRLAEVVDERVPVELDRREDLRVGPERDGSARRLRLADLLDLLRGLAARELHLEDAAIALDLRDELCGKRVDARDADAVQATGHLVAVAAELAARVENRQDDLERGHVLALGVLSDRDAAAVVYARERAVFVYHCFDFGAVACEGLVHGVVDNLVDQVVQAARTGRADVHTGALAHMLETFENLNVPSIVAATIGQFDS